MKIFKVNKNHLSYQDIIHSIASTITSNKPPAWFRALQIVSGIISLILSILLLIAVEYSVLTVNTIILLLSITLLTIGVERVATGIMLLKLYSSLPKTAATTEKPSGRSKKVTPFTNIGFGTLAIVFAVIAFVYPNLVSERSPNMLSIAISVMFNGFARIVQGIFDRSQPTWFRAFSIGIGALSIGTSMYVTNSNMFGITFPIRTLFIVLLVYGIGMIVYGITGKLSLDEILKKKIHSRDE
jgi:uncharacterized membrane protein HdeD (DUF308 family)